MKPITLFTDPKAYADPEGWHAVAARLRREDPVARVEVDGFDPFWAVTRHADVIEIERQAERFPNTPESVLMPSAMKPSRGGPPVPVKTLINMDGEQHRAYRNLTNEWFKPGALEKTLQPRIEQLATKYVDRMAELGGACDFAMDVARFYPLQVIMNVLGVPESDELRMLELTQKLFGADDPRGRTEARADPLPAARMTSLAYPVYDADNHLYESEEAMTAGLPRKWRKEFCYVDVGGRKKLAIGGTISEFVPNPTFEVLAASGRHEKWYRAENTEGLTLREFDTTDQRRIMSTNLKTLLGVH